MYRQSELGLVSFSGMAGSDEHLIVPSNPTIGYRWMNSRPSLGNQTCYVAGIEQLVVNDITYKETVRIECTTNPSSENNMNEFRTKDWYEIGIGRIASESNIYNNYRNPNYHSNNTYKLLDYQVD